ncbi:hypothetical protein ADL00_19090 [Streptomyces sp. AS58]|uniref:Uncharacterized protein n=1 Tax=Streptomyces cadmiisoli TaxID=2184053 RepID=A0A2Z4J2S9_9ACTN|nr:MULTISPECIES: hypothetical protein [Streptomyces]AWW38733.1 hypothetical protein DN051_20400 [Streptomyces cadmiisoli]KOV65686.1 hypothetical protein ADL00_19090 [Streptomyces sp. AS58]
MLPATWTSGRRGAVIGASAAVVCLGAVLTGFGGGDGGGGYVAVGAGGGPSGRAQAGPTGDVRLVPLDGTAEPDRDGTAAEGAGSGRSSTETGPGSDPTGDPDGATGPDGGDGSDGAGSAAASGGRADAPGADAPSGEGARPGPAAGSPRPSTPSPTPAAPPGPAVLSVGAPEREPTDRRWCEKVTLAFHNTGASAVRSGTVTFGTHVIGALGIDWATLESEVALPAPIGAGARKEGTWTVCVDAWRVPLGMHIETRDVDVRWK